MRCILAFALIVAFASSASASLTIVPGVNLIGLPIAKNDFNSNLQSLLLNQLYRGADIEVTAAGSIQFFLHASESGFTNRLVQGSWNGAGTDFLGGPGSLIIGSESENLWSDAGLAIGSPITVSAGDKFSSLGIGFAVKDNPANSLDALAGTKGFGVFRSGGSNVGYSQLFIGFDDHGAGPDKDYDDMIVSVKFTRAPGDVGAPVPEASTIAVWSVLSLLGGVVAYKKRG